MYAFGIMPMAYGMTYSNANGRMPQNVPLRSHFNCWRTIGSSALRYSTLSAAAPMMYSAV